MQQKSGIALHKLVGADLFHRCITADGEAFTIERKLGEYRQCFVKEEDGWRCQQCSDLTAIRAATEQVRLFAGMYPELTVTYPNRILSDPRTESDCTTAWVLSAAMAVISVPAEFAAEHGGMRFLSLLKEEWKEQLGTLSLAVEKLLLRHEIRTAQLFGKDGVPDRVTVRIAADRIETAIWTLPLAKAGFYPLQWDGELCGMAKALGETLGEALSCDIFIRREYELAEHQAYAIELIIKET